MIYNIRSTHGGGKSTIVRTLLDKNPYEPINPSPKGRPEGYKVLVPGLKKPVYVVGPYETACGGADAIQPYADIWPRVVEYAKLGHVVFEGALVSCSVGSIGEAMAARKKDCAILFLDTPVEVCLDRINKRRVAKGNTEPVKPDNTVAKHKSVAASRPKLEALGIRCVTLNHKKAYKMFMEILLENRTREVGRA